LENPFLLKHLDKLGLKKTSRQPLTTWPKASGQTIDNMTTRRNPIHPISAVKSDRTAQEWWAAQAQTRVPTGPFRSDGSDETTLVASDSEAQPRNAAAHHPTHINQPPASTHSLDESGIIFISTKISYFRLLKSPPPLISARQIFSSSPCAGESPRSPLSAGESSNRPAWYVRPVADAGRAPPSTEKKHGSRRPLAVPPENGGQADGRAPRAASVDIGFADPSLPFGGKEH
jgi:hypothetical protein